MGDDKTSEVLESIASSCCLRSATEVAAKEGRFDFGESGEKLREAIKDELSVVLTSSEVEALHSFSDLSTLVQSRLTTNHSGKNLVDIYGEVEQLARGQYHPKIPYHWHAKWNDFLKTGNWFTRPDGLDSVEIVIRMEDEYGIPISDPHVEAMQTVGQTVRYLWSRTGGNFGTVPSK